MSAVHNLQRFNLLLNYMKMFDIIIQLKTNAPTKTDNAQMSNICNKKPICNLESGSSN